MRILGIDPGSVFCGYGVIDANGKELKIVEYGTIEVKKKAEEITLRMKEIYERIHSVIERTQPATASIEATFFGKNVQSLLKLTMARSAALMAIINSDVSVNEYSAKEIKRSVTGRGNASKEQVRFMVKALLGISSDTEYFDTTDALAIAICHHYNSDSSKLKRNTSWAQFIKENPQKIAKL
ncbi:MAG: crossover junction endodeoxyribonuclease RuvC [Ignavibacteria bacterium]|jgi:crossover junction endodeoxyribonuclease RuvC|nr:crossover junction endodeoxyribonuclease RuvC [Ignavibacteria bacterium]